MIPDRIAIVQGLHMKNWDSPWSDKLLAYFQDWLQVQTPTVLGGLVEEAAKCNHEALEYLLKRFGDQLPITHWVVEAAAASQFPYSLSLLQTHRASSMVVTKRVVGRIQSQKAMEWFLQHHGDTIPITGSLLWRLWLVTCGTDQSTQRLEDRPKSSCADFFKQVLARCYIDHPVREDVLVELAQHFEEAEVRLFLSRVDDDLQLSGKIVKAAFGTKWEEVVWAFLDRVPRNATLDEDIMIAIAERCDEDFMIRPFDYWDGHLAMTAKFIEAITRNKHAKGIDAASVQPRKDRKPSRGARFRVDVSYP